MIEFVGLPPNLENHISGCHGNHAFLCSPYLISCEENFISHSDRHTVHTYLRACTGLYTSFSKVYLF